MKRALTATALAVLAVLLSGCGPDCSGSSGDAQTDAQNCYGRN